MSIKEKYKVQSIDYFQCREWILKKHYAKRMCVIMFSFGLYDSNNGRLMGICTFGPSPSDKIQNICGSNYKTNVIELNRLITENRINKNIHSYFISQSIKLLPKPMIVVSYSDSNMGHNGFIYQASNFLYTGESGEQYQYQWNSKKYSSRKIEKRWFVIRGLSFNEELSINDNFRSHGGEIKKIKLKYRYVYLHGSKNQKKQMKQNLKYYVLPYPKGDNKRYDASYTPNVQINLF